jgi:hypothetical protein
VDLTSLKSRDDRFSDVSSGEDDIPKDKNVGPINEELKYCNFNYEQNKKVSDFIKKLTACHTTQLRNVKVMATRLAHEYLQKHASKVCTAINESQRSLVEQFISYRERNETRMSKLDEWQRYTADSEEMITSLVNVLDAEYAIKRTVKPYVKKETKARRNFWDAPPPAE